MKEITEAALQHILLAHPNATVETRNGDRIVRIPMYDVTNDRSYVEERKVKPDPVETPVGIVPVMNVRKGAKFEAGGEPRVSPLGKLYRIIGYSPPPKKDDDK